MGNLHTRQLLSESQSVERPWPVDTAPEKSLLSAKKSFKGTFPSSLCSHTEIYHFENPSLTFQDHSSHSLRRAICFSSVFLTTKGITQWFPVMGSSLHRRNLGVHQKDIKVLGRYSEVSRSASTSTRLVIDTDGLSTPITHQMVPFKLVYN